MNSLFLERGSDDEAAHGRRPNMQLDNYL